MANHRKFVCEGCGKEAKVKNRRRMGNHDMCYFCYLKSTSMSSHINSEKAARKYKPRGSLSFDEQKVLYKGFIKNGLDEEKIKTRLRRLKRTIRFNSNIFKLASKETKESFKESFAELKSRSRR